MSIAVEEALGMTFQAMLEVSPDLLDRNLARRAGFLARAEALAVVQVEVKLRKAPQPERQRLLLKVAAASTVLSATRQVDVPSLVDFDLNLLEFKLPNLNFEGVDFAFGGIPSFGLCAIPLLGDVKPRWAVEPRPNGVARGSLSVSTAGRSASIGFLELREKVANSVLKHAFYFFAQEDKLAQQIPTPIGTLYLREVGFGFGHRYTHAGIAQADRANSSNELVKILDEVSKYQGNLDSIHPWEPTDCNDGQTLAMRAMINVTAAFTSDTYNAEIEEARPNPFLFDVIAAIRSDLTCLVNVRSWVSMNDADGIDARENATLKSNSVRRGYLFLPAQRQECLASFIADGKGHVGNHPPLRDTLKQPIKRTQFSATLYLRPGPFHFELGWP